MHVVTVNDYLASYQSELMGRVFRALGMTTGVILTGQTPEQRREQYAADITYGTNNEFGFDYLRDNMAWQASDMVQRGHHFAIVDEVDSILIDEARTPLIISGPASGEANRWFAEFAEHRRTASIEGDDYEVDEKKRTVGVLEPGIEKVEDYLGIDNLYESANTPLISFLNNSIKASALFKRDKDYVVMNGEVLIVDEHTGRILVGRRYNEGIHQAIEAKEGVQVKAENQTLATVTLQNYFRLYSKLSGMTGTAETEAAEFMSHLQARRRPDPDQQADDPQGPVATWSTRARPASSTRSSKTSSSATAPASRCWSERRASRRASTCRACSPSAASSTRCSTRRTTRARPRSSRRPGASAPSPSPPTWPVVAPTSCSAATPSSSPSPQMHDKGLSPIDTPDEYEAAWDAVYDSVKEQVEIEADKVVDAGGLYVLGTERHESRRIDNQLRGRSGRQGDPGESRFYLSLQDDLMRLFNSGAAEALMGRSAVPDDMAIESKVVSRAIRSAQSQVEARNAEIRKNVLKYDDVLNRQREAIYSDRRHILEGDDLHERVQKFLEDVIGEVVDQHTGEGPSDDWDLDALWTELKTLYPVSITIDEVLSEVGNAAA